MIIYGSIFLRMKKCQNTVVEKIKIHILGSIIFSRNCAGYQKCKNCIEPDRPQMTI